MEKFIWLASMIFSAAVFTAIGIFALLRKRPMHFWSGTRVSEDEISDIKKYNRANGIMWLAYSIFFLLAGILGLFSMTLASIFLMASLALGLPALIICYTMIYKKYKK